MRIIKPEGKEAFRVDILPATSFNDHLSFELLAKEIAAHGTERFALKYSGQRAGEPTAKDSNGHYYLTLALMCQVHPERSPKAYLQGLADKFFEVALETVPPPGIIEWRMQPGFELNEPAPAFGYHDRTLGLICRLSIVEDGK